MPIWNFILFTVWWFQIIIMEYVCRLLRMFFTWWKRMSGWLSEEEKLVNFFWPFRFYLKVLRVIKRNSVSGFFCNILLTVNINMFYKLIVLKSQCSQACNQIRTNCIYNITILKVLTALMCTIHVDISCPPLLAVLMYFL